MATFQAPPAHARPNHAPSIPMSTAPAGTFSPGTKVQVGSHRVIIEKYLSEGGFAHVYVVRPSATSNETAVLKRVAVPDKDALASMRTEVETMKKLKGHKHIVTYIDSHASQLKGGGYEVFLLMEHCAGGGLIDFMNTRLKNRLTEPEILEIFSDTAEGLACMHYLKPPLLHRDLKVENILISKIATSKRYKLCDFGSTAPPRPAATNAAEGRLIEEDVQKNTTLQYRSPEMIDVYRRRPIDEKSDIWALGVFLYKLCYYTTPFEEQGQMAILSASFKFPAYPAFSDRLKALIATMLMEDPRKRPNIYQVVKEACAMRRVDVPIKDIYAGRTASEARSTQQLPSREPNVKSPPPVGATVAAPEPVKQYIPEVAPMRRGRPTAPGQQKNSGRPSPSPGKKAAGDPFAALDSKNYDERVEAVEELSNKFPSIDQFALLQDRDKFQFSDKSGAAAETSILDQRVTNALADEAFAKTDSAPVRTTSLPQSGKSPTGERTPSSQPAKPPPHKTQAPKSSLHQPQPHPKPSTMVSTGTMTSPIESQRQPNLPKFDDRPVWRVPQRNESPRLAALTRFDSLNARSPNLGNMAKSSSNMPDFHASKSPSSSRPSLEGQRPSSMDLGDEIHRSRSANARSSGKGLPTTDAPQKRESFFRRHSSRNSKQLTPEALQLEPAPDSNIESDLDYLRARGEEEASTKLPHRRTSSRTHKHASLPSLSGTKNILAGKFGDAKRRFEPSRSSNSRTYHNGSLLIDDDDRRSPPLQANDLRNSPPQPLTETKDDDTAIDETEPLSPAMRRELERLELEKEERRVEDAAQAYRARLANGKAANGGPPQRHGSARASAIQNRVKNLLDESGRTSPVRKTAEGYGRYTDIDPAPRPTSSSASASNSSLPATSQSVKRSMAPRTVQKPDKPLPIQPSQHAQLPRGSSLAPSTALPTLQKSATIAAPTISSVPSTKPLPARPSAPPKPIALRTGGDSSAASPALQSAGADGLDGTTEPVREAEISPDWEEKFSQKYPRLSVELVDEDLGRDDINIDSIGGKPRPGSRPLRVRDV